MKRYATELKFLGRIKSDGSGIESVDSEELESATHVDTRFTLNCLSITEGTYIASGFSTYVVKLKNPPNR